MYSPGDVPVSTMPSKNQRKKRSNNSLAVVLAAIKSNNINNNNKPRASRRQRLSIRNRQANKDTLNNSFPLTRELATSWMNPFSYSACVPDGSNGTGCFSLKQDILLSTGAAGTCCGIIATPIPNALYYADTNSTAALPVISGNFSAATQIANVNSLYGKARPVSMGLRGAFVGATQTDQGVIIVGQVNGSLTPNSFGSDPISTVAGGMQNYKIFPLREGFEVTWSPEDLPDISNFIPTSNASVAVNSSFTVPYLLAYVFGATISSACLNIELVVNYEGQYESQTFMSGGINVAQKPAEAGWYERAKNYLLGYESISPYIRSVGSAYTATKSIQRYAVPALGTLANGLYSAGMMGHSGLPRNRIRYY